MLIKLSTAFTIGALLDGLTKVKWTWVFVYHHCYITRYNAHYTLKGIYRAYISVIWCGGGLCLFRRGRGNERTKCGADCVDCSRARLGSLWGVRREDTISSYGLGTISR